VGLDPQLFDKRPTLIDSAGQAFLSLDAAGLMQLTVIALAGATVTVSRVADIYDASGKLLVAPSNLTANGQYTVTAGTVKTIPVDWRFYYVTVSGGQAWVSLV
jgi:hypothetical protein